MWDGRVREAGRTPLEEAIAVPAIRRGPYWGKLHVLDGRSEWSCGVLRAVDAAARSRSATRPATLSRKIGHRDAWERSPMVSLTGPFPPPSLLQGAVTEAIRASTLGTEVAPKFRVSLRACCTAAE